MMPKTLTASIRRTRLWFVPKMELDEFNSRQHANIKLQLAIARPVTFRRRYSRPIPTSICANIHAALIVAAASKRAPLAR
jgi:hypothetical protein